MNPKPANKFSEKRKELRQPGQGLVRVEWGDPVLMLEGRLKDMSPSGFRMVHESRGLLSAGQRVEYVHFASRGKARVVWTRISGAHVETGFMVIPE